MNIYLVPLNEGEGCFIKKILAKSIKHAEEKLHKYFFDKYDWVEGDTLDEIVDQLWEEEGIDVGKIYEIEDFT